MPWKEKTIMQERLEFIYLATKDGANRRRLCRRFGISPKTGYKWLNRFYQDGPEALKDRSKRPRNSPNKTSKSMEEEIIKVRRAHPVWGARKIKRMLENKRLAGIPSASTVTSVLKRNGLLKEEEQKKRKPYKRFEAERPNQLWQMDFKGDFRIGKGRCYPLTILDDCSRFSLAVKACSNQRKYVVKDHLVSVFKQYGLPQAMLMDNGNPWRKNNSSYSSFSVWLIRMGVKVIHSRPYNPQTLGKDERFHRTLKTEAIGNRFFYSLDDCQRKFDDFRYIYNFKRPHQSLNMETPASLYQESEKEFPKQLEAIEYSSSDEVRKVQQNGEIYFKGYEVKVGSAFFGQPVAVRHTLDDGIYNVYYCHQKIKQFDLRVEKRYE